MIEPNDELILDCSTGSCYIRPSEAVLRKFEPALQHHRHHARLPQLSPRSGPDPGWHGDPARRNVSLVSELPLLQRYGAMGIGLYRTEFMFMIRPRMPPRTSSTASSAASWKRAASTPSRSGLWTWRGQAAALRGLPARRRTRSWAGAGSGSCSRNPDFFLAHLRAILRTTVHGRVNILLPMVADLDELLAPRT